MKRLPDSHRNIKLAVAICSSGVLCLVAVALLSCSHVDAVPPTVTTRLPVSATSQAPAPTTQPVAATDAPTDVPSEVPESQLNLINPPKMWRVKGVNLRLIESRRTPIQPASFSEAQRTSGLASYVRAEPADRRYDAMPDVSELNQPIRSFTTPGQYESVWFSVYGLSAHSNLSVVLDQPLHHTGGNAVIPASAVKTQVVRDWPQLRSLYSTSLYWITPELLEPRSTLDLPKGQSRTIWFTIHTPVDAPAGTYTSSAVVRDAKGTELARVPVQLKVLPFHLLAKPGQTWAMYTTSSVRWGKLSDAALEAELVDMQDHGINCIVIDLFGQTQINFDVKDGHALHVNLPVLSRFQKIRRKIGFTGPVVLYAGPRLENALVSVRGEKLPNFAGEIPQLHDEVFAQEFRDIIADMDLQMKSTGIDPGYTEWYFAGIDEPGVSIGRQARAMWEFEQARKAGARTWTTLDGPFSQTVAPVTDAPVFHRGYSVTSAQQARQRLDETIARHQEYWVYGGGAYENQEGNTIQNRHHNGVMVYKAGIHGFANWTYQWPSGNPWSDMESGPTGVPGKKAMITYSDPAGSTTPISTLQWEGIRMGIDDYKYLYTLERVLAVARENKTAAALAEEIQVELDSRLDRVPWPERLPESFDNDLFNQDSATKLRAFVAQSIVKLQSVTGAIKE